MTESLQIRHSLWAFVQIGVEPSLLEELRSTADFGEAPLSKTGDLRNPCQWPQPVNLEQLPYDRPQDAMKYFRYQRAKDALRSELVRLVDGGEWRLEVRERGEISLVVLPSSIIAAASLSDDYAELKFEGRTFVDLTMVRTSPISLDERAARLLARILKAADPKVHTLEDVRIELNRELGSSFSIDRVRHLMRTAGADEAWFKPGRRASRIKNNPRII